MANPFTPYKNRLTARLQENPEMEMMSRSIAGISLPFQQLNNQLQSSLQQGNATPGAKVLATTRGQQQLQETSSGIYTQAISAKNQRTDALQNEIGKVTMQEEQYDEQKKAEKAAKRTAVLRTALQIAGGVAGGIISAPGGLAGITFGAKTGAGLGQAAGGLVGIDKNGHLTAEPDQMDPEAIMQGAGDVLGAYSEKVNEKSISDMTVQLSETMQSPEFIKSTENWTPQQWALNGSLIQSALLRGDRSFLDRFMANYSSGGNQMINQYSEEDLARMYQ